MAIPVLDLSPLLCRITHPSNQANPPTASQIQEEQHEVNTTLSSLRAACEDKGIFILTNHHIPCSLQDRALEQSKRFFALPMEEKKRLGEEKSWGRSCRGYQAFGGEAYEEGQVPDFKEVNTIHTLPHVSSFAFCLLSLCSLLLVFSLCLGLGS